MSGLWRAVVALSLTFAACAAAFFANQPHPTGDEPRYLALAFSLAEDGDFDLTNQAKANVIGKLYPELSALTPADYCMCDKPRTPLRNPHAIGLPLILGPLLAAGVSVTGLRVALALLAALTGWQLLELMRRILGPSWHVWAAWAAVVFSAPFLIYATQFYPDFAAVFLIVVSLRLILRSTTASLILAIAAAAFLPWFHLKFAPITAALVIAALVHSNRRAILGIALVVLAAVALYAFTNYALYGSISPSAAYRDYTQRPQNLRNYEESFYRNVVGGFFSATYGWIPFAPIHWIGLAGIIPLLRRAPGWMLLALAAAGAFLASLCTSESIMHGWAPPGRLLVVLIPFIGFPLCLALRSSRALVAIGVVLAVLSGAIAVQGVRHFNDFYPYSMEMPSLFLPSKLAPAWPVFRDIRGDQIAMAEVDARQPGIVIQTLHLPMTKGAYDATVEAKGSSANLLLQAMSPRWEAFAEQPITSAELSPTEFRTFRLRFPIFVDQNIHAAVTWNGSGSVQLRNLILAHASKPPSPLQSWPLSSCWILSVILTGVLIASCDKTRAL